MKVHELARELGVGERDVRATLEALVNEPLTRDSEVPLGYQLSIAKLIIKKLKDESDAEFRNMWIF